MSINNCSKSHVIQDIICIRATSSITLDVHVVCLFNNITAYVSHVVVVQKAKTNRTLTYVFVSSCVEHMSRV